MKAEPILTFAYISYSSCLAYYPVTSCTNDYISRHRVKFTSVDSSLFVNVEKEGTIIATIATKAPSNENRYKLIQRYEFSYDIRRFQFSRNWTPRRRSATKKRNWCPRRRCEIIRFTMLLSGIPTVPRTD